MFAYSYIRTIAAVVGILAIIALGAYTNLTLKEARYLYGGPVTISVVGTGEVVAKPDIGLFSFSVFAEADDAATAQDQSAEVINAILAYLKDGGVEDKDIKTQYYNLNPRYEYIESICNTRGFCPPGERVLKGYEVNQSVSVKVRNVDKAGDLISGVGGLGATNVSGLSFTIDDEDELKAQAREDAINDAKQKAEKLAEDLGLSIVRIASFWEDEGYYPIAYGLGGAEVAESASFDARAVPDIPIGENTITTRVNIAYELR